MRWCVEDFGAWALKQVSASSASIRRDSPLRNVSPKGEGQDTTWHSSALQICVELLTKASSMQHVLQLLYTVAWLFKQSDIWLFHVLSIHISGFGSAFFCAFWRVLVLYTIFHWQLRLHCFISVFESPRMFWKPFFWCFSWKPSRKVQSRGEHLQSESQDRGCVCRQPR